MSQGFVALRRGLLDHIEQGKMSRAQAACYMVILLKANHGTGIWWGSSAMLSDSFRGSQSMPERTARHAMCQLESAGYIKRFKLGRSYRYPFLVNKYECVDVAGSRRLLDAESTTDYLNPVYIDCRLVAASLPPIYKQQPKQEINKKVLVFDSPELKITTGQDAALADAFPWVDRQAEYRRMRTWLVVNGKQRKKHGQFAYNWQARAHKPEGRQSQPGSGGLEIPAVERNS